MAGPTTHRTPPAAPKQGSKLYTTRLAANRNQQRSTRKRSHATRENDPGQDTVTTARPTFVAHHYVSLKAEIRNLAMSLAAPTDG